MTELPIAGTHVEIANFFPNGEAARGRVIEVRPDSFVVAIDWYWPPLIYITRNLGMFRALSLEEYFESPGVRPPDPRTASFLSDKSFWGKVADEESHLVDNLIIKNLKRNPL